MKKGEPWDCRSPETRSECEVRGETRTSETVQLIGSPFCDVMFNGGCRVGATYVLKVTQTKRRVIKENKHTQ